jgi:5,10-methylenetetrahydromethanopterin reductase
MEAATIDELAGGRLRLGLGAATWTLQALGEADERIARPRTATIEALRIVQAILRGEVGPESSLFAIRPDASLDFEPIRRDLSLYVGAVNRRMLEASGAWADGVYLGAITSPGYTRWAVGAIEDEARGAGRDPAGIDLIANVLVSVDPDRAAAPRAVRSVLAYYLHRVEGVVVDQAGADPDAVADVRRAVRLDGLEVAARRVSEDLIDTFAAAGTPTDVADALDRYRGAGLRGALAWHVLGPDPEAGLRSLATEVLAA